MHRKKKSFWNVHKIHFLKSPLTDFFQTVFVLNLIRRSIYFSSICLLFDFLMSHSLTKHAQSFSQAVFVRCNLSFARVLVFRLMLIQSIKHLFTCDIRQFMQQTWKFFCTIYNWHLNLVWRSLYFRTDSSFFTVLL